MISYEELDELRENLLESVRGYVRIINSLPRHYFPPGVLGFTRLMWEAFIHPDEYERRREVVVHEKVHNWYPYAPERDVRSHAEYLVTSCGYC